MPVTMEQAQRIVAEAHSRAREQGLRVAVAVVDEGGALQTLSRMDDAPPLSAQIAEAKAAGAAVWHRDGDSLKELEGKLPAFFSAVSNMTRLPILPGLGSVVLREGDAVRGAVGVSGAAPEQDKDCAQSGIAAVLGG